MGTTRPGRMWFLLAGLVVLEVGWLVVRGERDVTESSSRTDATAATPSTPIRSEPGAPPRTVLTEEPPVSEPHDQVVIHGQVSSSDVDARLAGEVDITYWDTDREDEQHATATIQPDHTFRLTLPRGVHLRLAEVVPEREGCNWRKTFLALEKKLEEADPLEHEREIQLRVSVGFMISGLVVDQASRAPIASAEVARGAEPPWTGGKTNAAGEFHLPCVFSSSTPTRLVVGIAVRSADHLGTEVDVPEPEVGTEATTVIALQRGVNLRGRVIDVDGRGVMAALRAMRDVGGDTPLGRRIAYCVSTRSDPDGGFELPALPPIDHVEVRATSFAHEPARVRDLDLRQEPSELIIRLPASIQFEIVATYPDGTLVNPYRGHLVFMDSGGDRHEAEWRGLKGWRFGGEIGHPHPFEVRAIREVDGVPRVYQGDDIAMAGGPPPPGQPAIEVPVTLREVERKVPQKPEGMKHFGFDSASTASRNEGLPDWGFTWDLELIDDVTRQPIREETATLLVGSAGLGGIPTDSIGRLRLSIGGGLRQIVLRVAGYEPLEIETLGLDQGYAEATLALRRR